jgi:nucleoside transporter
MAQGAVNLDYQTATTKPPLDLGIRLKLSTMMFLEFAVWGSWAVVFGNYLMAPPVQGGLGFDGSQFAAIGGTMALGAIISTMFAGQLADRLLSSEYLMAIFHLVGAVLLYGMATFHTFQALWWVSLAYALVYNPTIALSNSLAFANVPDATRDFPTLRVLGTIGWIAGGMVGIDLILGKGAITTNKPLLLAAGLSAFLGLFSLVLPHTPPSGKKGDALPFLRAFALLRDPSFGVFFGISFVITIALAFYYGFAGPFLADVGVKKVPSIMSIGQWSEIGFMLALPFALKRWGMKGVLIVGMAAWATRYALFSIGFKMGPGSAAFIPVIIGVALHGVCFDFFLAAGFIHTENKAPASIRGSAQALFTFLTYGVGMWLGYLIAGNVVDRYTVTNVVTRVGVRNWTMIWMWPSLGAALCLIVFVLLWQDRPGKVADAKASELDPVSEAAASPKEPDKVSQTAM